jgi:hypothetical protein
MEKGLIQSTDKTGWSQSTSVQDIPTRNAIYFTFMSVMRIFFVVVFAVCECVGEGGSFNK